MPISEDYHAHVYFEPDTRAIAEQVISELSEKFDVKVGSYHDLPVGPHPTGSCQITVSVDNFGVVMDWLARNRSGLTVFTHINTGDVMKDHTDHTIWMGEMMELNLDVLRKFI